MGESLCGSRFECVELKKSRNGEYTCCEIRKPVLRGLIHALS
jgi:hypothetical protein